MICSSSIRRFSTSTCGSQLLRDENLAVSLTGRTLLRIHSVGNELLRKLKLHGPNEFKTLYPLVFQIFTVINGSRALLWYSNGTWMGSHFSSYGVACFSCNCNGSLNAAVIRDKEDQEDIKEGSFVLVGCSGLIYKAQQALAGPTSGPGD